MDLGMSVLASLGSGHVNDLARAALDHNVSAEFMKCISISETLKKGVQTFCGARCLWNV